MNTISSTRRFLSASVIALCASCVALSFAQAEVSEFDKAAPTADAVQAPVKMTEANLQRLLAETLDKDCDKATGRCRLTGVDSEGSGWTFGCNAGVGSRNVATGTTVINVGDEGSNNQNQPYYGCSVTYRSYKCQTNVIVSKPMKLLFETSALSGLNADGSMKRTNSPAELNLMSLYATLQQKLDTCRSTNQ